MNSDDEDRDLPVTSSGISSGISSGTSSGTSSGISSGISSETSSGISSGISSGTSSGISSGTLEKLAAALFAEVAKSVDEKLPGWNPRRRIPHSAAFERNPVIQIPRLTTQEKIISKAHGGKINPGNCSVKFPPGLLKHDANIKVTVESGAVSDRSTKGIPISPTIGCDLSHVELVPGYEMEVKILAYCFASEPVPIALLSKAFDSEDWVIEKELMLGRDRKLKFKTKSFSRKYYTFMRTIGLSWLLNFPVIPHLYYNKFGVFKSYLCIDDKSVIDGLKAEHKSNGFASALVMPQHLSAKLNESIAVELQCAHPSAASFGDDNRYDLVSDELIVKAYDQKDFVLRNIPDHIERGFVEVHFTLAKIPPDTTPRPMLCRLEWPMFSGKLAAKEKHFQTKQKEKHLQLAFQSELPGWNPRLIGTRPVETTSTKDSSTQTRTFMETAGTQTDEVVTTFGNLDGGVAISKSIHKVIGSEPEQLNVGGCLADFPPHSFSESTPVNVMAELNTSKRSKKFILFTPSLYVDANGLQAKIRVKLPSWCVNNGQQKVEARILHLPKDADDWEDTGTTLPVTSRPFFEFYWQDFCAIAVGDNKDSPNLQQISRRIAGNVYVSDANEVSIVFHKNDKEKLTSESLAAEEVKARMTSATPPKNWKIRLNQFTAKHGDIVEAHVKCRDPAELMFVPEDPFTFEVDENFDEEPFVEHHGVVLGSLEEKRLICMQCTVHKAYGEDRKKISGPSLFTCNWMPTNLGEEQKQSKKVPCVKVNVNVNADQSKHTETENIDNRGQKVIANKYVGPKAHVQYSESDTSATVSSSGVPANQN